MLLTIKELTAALTVSQATIYRWRMKKGFPQPIRMGGYATAYDSHSVEKWLRKQPGAGPDTNLGIAEGHLRRIPRTRRRRATSEAAQ